MTGRFLLHASATEKQPARPRNIGCWLASKGRHVARTPPHDTFETGPQHLAHLPTSRELLLSQGCGELRLAATRVPDEKYRVMLLCKLRLPSQLICGDAPLMNEWTLGSVPFERGKLDACDLNCHVPGSRHQTIAVQWYGVAMYCSVRTEKGVWEKHASLHQCFVAATNIKYCCLLRRPWPTATVARGRASRGYPRFGEPVVEVTHASS